MELAHTDAGLAVDALLGIVKNWTYSDLSGLSPDSFQQSGPDSALKTLLIKSVVIDLDKGSKSPFDAWS